MNKMRDHATTVGNQGTLRMHVGDSMVVLNMVMVIKDIEVHDLKPLFFKLLIQGNHVNPILLGDSPMRNCKLSGFLWQDLNILPS